MKFFAERKCPGQQGEQGLRGCRGAVGGGTEGDVRALIAKRVCVEYAEFASGVQLDFWDVFARGSDPFVGFCETTGPWRSESVGATKSEMIKWLGIHLPRAADECAPAAHADPTIARHTRRVYSDVFVARTIVGVGDKRYVLISVETGKRVLFVFSMDELRCGEMIRVNSGCSVEQYLLDIRSNGNEACEMLTSLGRLKGASERVRAALDAGGTYVSVSQPDLSNLLELLKRFHTAVELNIAIVGIMRHQSVIYAVIVPYVVHDKEEAAYTRPYIQTTTHVGATVIVARETDDRIVAITAIESPTGATVADIAQIIRVTFTLAVTADLVDVNKLGAAVASAATSMYQGVLFRVSAIRYDGEVVQPRAN
jgi:hypothetical protein